MTTRTIFNESSLTEQPIEQLQFTLETTRILKALGVRLVKDLISARSDETNPLRLDSKSAIEVREVLASRGL